MIKLKGHLSVVFYISNIFIIEGDPFEKGSSLKLPP